MKLTATEARYDKETKMNGAEYKQCEEGLENLLRRIIKNHP
jgi:hypothetical protein